MAVPPSGALQYFLAVEKQVALEVHQAANLAGALIGAFSCSIFYTQRS